MAPTADVAPTLVRVDAAGLSGPRFAALPPLSLYIHIPWCLRKCPYCDFNSHEARGEVPETAYLDALITEPGKHIAKVLRSLRKTQLDDDVGFKKYPRFS